MVNSSNPCPTNPANSAALQAVAELLALHSPQTLPQLRGATHGKPVSVHPRILAYAPGSLALSAFGRTNIGQSRGPARSRGFCTLPWPCAALLLVVLDRWFWLEKREFYY